MYSSKQESHSKMSHPPKVVEFIGLPGSGKSTVFHELKKQLEARGFRVLNLTKLVDEIQKSFLLKLLFTLNAFIFSFSMSFRLINTFLLRARSPVKSMTQVMYLMRLFHLMTSKRFHTLAKDNHFIIADQFIIQAYASIVISSDGEVDLGLVNVITDSFENQYRLIVSIKCSERLSLERIRQRNNQRTRFDSWSNEVSMCKLGSMKNVFNVFNEAIIKCPISFVEVSADDNVKLKVKLIVADLLKRGEFR